jgi:hypothetical protein
VERKSEQNRNDELLRRLADGELNADEFRQLEERLLTDDALRERYIMMMGLESRLYEHFSVEVLQPLATTPRDRWRARSFVVAVMAVGLVVTGLILMRRPGNLAKDVGGQGLPVSKWDQTPLASIDASARSAAAFVERTVSEQQPVAIVTDVERSEASQGDPGLSVGTRLKAGTLAIRQGHVRLEFMNGAEVVLDAPAELELLRADAARLISGRVAARVPEQARGFVMSGPGTAVVDLGTEFVMWVNEANQTEVYVVDGEVEVSLLDSDGSTLRSERVKRSKSVRVGRNGSSLDMMSKPTVEFLSILNEAITPLTVSDDYVNSVRSLEPLVYWRFDDVRDGRIINAMGSSWAGRVVDKKSKAGAVSVENGYLRFRASDAPRFVELGTDQPLPNLNRGSFSFELWVNPDHLHNATLVATSPIGNAFSESQLNVIELSHQTCYLHTPATFRFLHRYPAARDGGMNLFAPNGYTPGRWHHIVAVKTPKRIQIYINGELVKEFEAESEDDNSAYCLILGQIKWTTLHRQFIGAMDEFALYQRALTPEEVRTHYSLASPETTR